MIGNLLGPEFKELIRNKDFAQLREILCEFSPVEIADIFIDLKADDEAVLLRLLPRQTAAEVFEQLPVHDQEETLHALGSEQVAQILNDIEPDVRTALLEELPAAATQKLLSVLSADERKIASQLLGYPKNSVGRLMTPEYAAIKREWNVGQVLEHLRKEGAKRESLNQLYVVDTSGALLDWVRLKTVVTSDLEKSVAELLEGSDLSLQATEDQERAVEAFKKYDVTILPVVDSHQKLLGVITVDDVLDVAEQESTEDIMKMAGMEAMNVPYLKINMVEMLKMRAPWLAILFVSELFTSTAMGYFEGEIQKAAVLAIFLPLILSSGGNSGSQATTLIIRAMALSEVRIADWFRVVKRELLSGLLLGCTLATLGFVRILVWQWLHFKDYGPNYMRLALTIGGSLVGVVLWGSFAGAMLPILLKKLRLDPATCSAPFVATLVDVTGIVIYFNVAYHLLKGFYL
jgi:magnesium transporter